MQTIAITFNPTTRKIAADGMYVGTTTDNISTQFVVTGIPAGYEGRLEFRVRLLDSNGRYRYPYLDLEAGVCVLTDTIMEASKRDLKLPVQLVITKTENDSTEVIASKNILIFDVAPSVDALGTMRAAYADQWTKAIVSVEQNEDGDVVITNMDGETSVVEIDWGATTTIPASRIVGVLSPENLPDVALDILVQVPDDAARFELTTNDAQTGDIVYVESTEMMYLIIDDTHLDIAAGYRQFQGKTYWAGISGSPTDNVDLLPYLTKVDGVEAGAEVNIIETVKVNGSALTPDADRAVDVTVPTKVSDINNDTGFVTNAVADLLNYYLKSETYTKSEVNSLLSPKLKFRSVVELPNEGESDTIYLVPATSSKTKNVKDEWIWVDSDWERIGSTEFVLTIVQSTTGITINNTELQDASTTDDGLMTKEGFTKLSGIEAGAEVNIIEEVQLNGTALTVDANRAVNVALTKSDVGLGNVDNTADLLKPVSAAQQYALDQKPDIAMGVEEWSSSLTYGLNAFTNYGGMLYLSLKADNVNHSPADEDPSDYEWWEPYSSGGGGTPGQPSPGGFKHFTIGDGTQTEWTLTHSLQTLDVATEMYYMSGYRTTDARVERININQVKIIFKSAPALNSVRVIVYAPGSVISDGSVVTKYSLGLDNVDNTSDLDKPVSTAQQTALDGKIDKLSTKPTAGTYTKVTINSEGVVTTGTTLLATDIPTIEETQVNGLTTDLNSKVDKVTGYGLSKNDFTDALNTKLTGIEDNAEVNIIETVKVDGTALTPDNDRSVNVDLSGKVDKVSGKDLSENDFTDALKTKLDNIESGAEVNVQADWSESDSADDAYIKNKPTLGTAAACDTGTTEGTIPLLGANGKLPNSTIPALAIGELQEFASGTVHTVANLITLSSAQQGDIAVVDAETDASGLNGVYFLNGVYSTVGDWVQIVGPSQVISVNGSSGVIVGLVDAADSGLKLVTNGSGKKVQHDVTVDTDDTAAAESPGYGGNFTIVSGVTRDSYGHVTKLTTKQINLPASDNTDAATAQGGVTDNAEHAILLKKTAGTTDETDGVSYGKTTDKVPTINPSTGVVTAPGFVGDLTGTASKAAGDEDGTNIKSNYVKSSSLATVATSGAYSDLSGKPTIPDDLADLNDDSTHRVVTDTEKTAWNAAQENVIEEVQVNGTALTPISKAVNVAVPTKVSDLNNDSGFLNTAEVQALIQSSQAAETSFVVVSELPSTGQNSKVIYLVPSTTVKTGNVKDEYIWIVPEGQSGYWELIGSTDMKLNVVQAATGITINTTELQDASSTDDGLMTSTLYNKLDGIEAGAQVNVHADWSENDNSEDSYIANKPTLGTAAACDTGTSEGDVPVIDSNGKIPSSVIPALSYTKRYAGTITGDGSTTSFTLTHDLGAIPEVSIYNSSGVRTATRMTVSTTQVVVSFKYAPAANETFSVIVIA